MMTRYLTVALLTIALSATSFAQRSSPKPANDAKAGAIPDGAGAESFPARYVPHPVHDGRS
jgi:hypothetical protein